MFSPIPKSFDLRWVYRNGEHILQYKKYIYTHEKVVTGSTDKTVETRPVEKVIWVDVPTEEE